MGMPAFYRGFQVTSGNPENYLQNEMLLVDYGIIFLVATVFWECVATLLSTTCVYGLFLQLSDGLNAIPSSEREKQDCSTVLSPQKLKLVDIGRTFSVT